MRFERTRQRLRALPEIAAWPDALDLVERAVHQERRSVWEFPFVACNSVGGREEAALPAAAALLAAVAAIHLVDDLLDEDPRGDYHRLGAGRAANLALAFQAAGHRLLAEVEADPGRLARLHACLAEATLATACGQALDAEGVAGEAEYWRVVERKTAPLFAAALALGALAGGGDSPVVDGLARLGDLLGRLVQVSDDAADALATPASADWRRPRGNLAMLYALTADHPEREAFGRLAAASDDPAALAQAQGIVVRCGGLSYCAYHILAFAAGARQVLAGIKVAHPAPLEDLVEEHLRPLHALLREAGVEAPEVLAAR
jgi:geranylgeranyl pyrophosphate synthase